MPSDILFMHKQGLRPWMQKLLGYASKRKKEIQEGTYNPCRKIVVIYDPEGGAGKSHLKRFGGYHRVWFSIPVMNNTRDLVAFALENESEVYTIDVPRSMELKKANEFWTGIERVADADLSDPRYTPRVSQFREKPLIIIFTNILPPKNMLSRDRWDIWTVDHSTWDLVKI